MKFLLVIILSFFCFGLFAQFHDDNIAKITSIEEAKKYANRYREVSFGIVNSELDVFLFDKVDINNLKASIGQVNTIYKRSTKFLKDTSIVMLNVQVIEFDAKRLSTDSINTLISQIFSKYRSGSSYWKLMKEFMSATCKFNGGPMSTTVLEKRFGISMTDKKKDEIFKWKFQSQPNVPCIIIIHQEAHNVPAFYAISYNQAG